MGCSLGRVKDNEIVRLNVIKMPVNKQHPNSEYTFGNQMKVNLCSRSNAFSATNKKTSELVTIRQYKLLSLVKYTEADVIEEITIHSHLVHENIISMLGVYRIPTEIYVVTEYQEMTRLQDLKLPLNIDNCRNVLKQIASSVAYCHKKQVALRNLFPGNIMIKSGANGYAVKIVDFSNSSIDPPNGEFLAKRLPDGAIHFMAPEGITGKNCSLPMDIWSIGAMLYLLITGSKPFEGSNDDELFTKMKGANYDINEEMKKKEYSNILNLIKITLIADPMARPSADEIMRCKWFTKG